MAVQKSKKSVSRRNMRRRANSGESLVSVAENKTTGELHRPHHVSPDGYYNGRQVTADKVNR